LGDIKKFVHNILQVIVAQHEPNNEQPQFAAIVIGKEITDPIYLLLKK